MASDGSLVVMSTKTVPGLLPARAPCGPSITSRTSAGKPTIENTTSDRSATALGLSAHFAPLASRASALDLVRLETVMEKPRSIRWPHMLRPMTPVPIQPSRVFPGATWGNCITIVSPLGAFQNLTQNDGVTDVSPAG